MREESFGKTAENLVVGGKMYQSAKYSVRMLTEIVWLRIGQTGSPAVVICVGMNVWI
jgi:hypothetical protein